MSGTFKASSSAPNASLVPKALTGSSVSSGNWAEQFFPAGTTFDVTHSTDTFSYTYTDTGNCQQWTDASASGSGALAADGDITGVNQCVVLSHGHATVVAPTS